MHNINLYNYFLHLFSTYFITYLLICAQEFVILVTIWQRFPCLFPDFCFV